jgi:glutathione synthase/RimK-type ligase-like ATP-grasp enzyme
MKRILILTELGDVHAYAVAEAIERKGGAVTLWHTADFPESSGETALFEGGEWRVSVRGPAMDLEDFRFDAVWHRRPTLGLGQEKLHPADQEFALRECRLFRSALFGLIAPGAFWVNPPEAIIRASKKPHQHQVAHEVGMATPDTAYTNDPDVIRAFLARRGGRAVYKPLHGVLWRDGETCWTPYTSLLTEQDLVADHLLRAAPGIYQELLPKAHELRVTVLGEHVFGARVLSQETETGRLDWRRSYHELRIEPCALQPELAQHCRSLLDRLGLIFGCFDFVVTPDGRTVFLEVNEGGQFLFIERYAGIPLLDAFAELLLQGRPNFAWSESCVTVRYSEVNEAVRAMEEDRARIHLPSPERSILEVEPEQSVAQLTAQV